MVTVNRQPTKLDYLSPTQFKFTISQLPKVEFFTTAANVPDLTLADAIIPTPFKPIPVMGTNLTFNNLSVTFIVDEFLENYRELHDWLTAIGFPKSRKQFRDFVPQLLTHRLAQLQHLKLMLVLWVQSQVRGQCFQMRLSPFSQTKIIQS